MRLELPIFSILAANPLLASPLPGEGAPEPIWSVGEVCGEKPRMGAAHEARCGEPTWVKAGPPQELKGSDGKPMFLWLQGWHWRDESHALTIWGEHYSPRGTSPTGGVHVFRFRLDPIP